MFRVHRHYLRAHFPRAGHDHRARAHQRLLVGEGYAALCVDGGQRGAQAHRAGDGGDYALGALPGRGLYESRLARRADGDVRALQLGAQPLRRVRVEGGDVLRVQDLYLLHEQAYILVSGERRGVYAQTLADLDALAAYAAGGAEDGCAFYHLLSHLMRRRKGGTADTPGTRRARCQTCRARRRGRGRWCRSP